MNLVTIMNFVRGVEPRNPNLDLLEPVVNQIALNKAYGFDNTFLLQYDALIDPKFQELFLAERDQHMELGIWFEVVQPLVEKVGIKWRGRPGYAWDWYVNPGFLPAYTHDEKIAMIDAFMEKFRETFGAYPQSVGSWLLDIDSVRYMTEKYAIRYFGICREQLAVDAYTLWGGPYNQPYYPSVHNILCPAQNAENQLNAPVFRLLGIEPIRGYNEKRYAKDPECYGCATMEPFWKYGQNKDYMEWFFKTYFDNENLGLAYTQIGQENSFGWKGMKDGLTLQLELVKRYADRDFIKPYNRQRQVKPADCLPKQIRLHRRRHFVPTPIRSAKTATNRFGTPRKTIVPMSFSKGIRCISAIFRSLTNAIPNAISMSRA